MEISISFHFPFIIEMVRNYTILNNPEVLIKLSKICHFFKFKTEGGGVQVNF